MTLRHGPVNGGVLVWRAVVDTFAVAGDRPLVGDVGIEGLHATVEFWCWCGEDGALLEIWGDDGETRCPECGQRYRLRVMLERLVSRGV